VFAFSERRREIDIEALEKELRKPKT